MASLHQKAVSAARAREERRHGNSRGEAGSEPPSPGDQEQGEEEEPEAELPSDADDGDPEGPHGMEHELEHELPEEEHEPEEGEEEEAEDEQEAHLDPGRFGHLASKPFRQANGRYLHVFTGLSELQSPSIAMHAMEFKPGPFKTTPQ